MASLVVDLIAKKALKNVAAKNINSKDPYFEEVAVYGRDGRPTGKVKKQKKGIPQGLSPKDAGILKKVRRRAYRLDMSLFNCCGIRFGWSSVIGFVPVIGDFLDCFMAYLVVRSCCDVDGGLPTAILSRMYFNIVLDFGIGLVPFLGDIADALFRANTRNAWILEEYLTQKAEEEKKHGGRIDGERRVRSRQGSPQGGRPSPPPRPQAAVTRGQGPHDADQNIALHDMHANGHSRPGR